MKTSLIQSQVIVSLYIPDSSTYKQVASCIVTAIKESEKIIIVILHQKKAISYLDVNERVEWLLQNSFYCSFVDQVGKRWLLQFPKPEAATIFTIIALSNKCRVNDDKVYQIYGGEGDIINENDSVTLSYSSYDISNKVTQPLEINEKFSINFSDESSYKVLFNKANVNSHFIVCIRDNIFSYVIVLSKEERKDPVIQNILKEEIQTDENNDNIDILHKNEVETNITKENYFEKEFLTEMNKYFRELSSSIIYVKELSNYYTVNDNLIISSIDNLINENRTKERLIKEKRLLIELLEKKKEEYGQRGDVREEIKSLLSKIEEQKITNKKKQDQKIDLDNKIVEKKKLLEELKLKLENDTNLQLKEAQKIEEIKIKENDLLKQDETIQSEIDELNKLLQETQNDDDELTELQDELDNLEFNEDDIRKECINFYSKLILRAVQNIDDSETFTCNELNDLTKQIMEEAADILLNQL